MTDEQNRVSVLRVAWDTFLAEFGDGIRHDITDGYYPEVQDVIDALATLTRPASVDAEVSVHEQARRIVRDWQSQTGAAPYLVLPEAALDDLRTAFVAALANTRPAEQVMTGQLDAAFVEANRPAEKARRDMAAALRNTPAEALREAGYLDRAADMLWPAEQEVRS